MSIEVTDELIQKLTEDWLDTLPKRYPSRPKHPYKFSPGFSLKMWWLCHKADWDYAHGKDLSHFGETEKIYWTKRSAAVLLATALGTTVAMAYAVRYFKMVREDHEKYSSIYYQQVEEGYAPGEFICYTLGYIPEGFELAQETTIENYHSETYINTIKDNQALTFHQIRIDEVVFDIDTENVEPIEIQLNTNQVAWFLDNSSNKVIYWNNGEYSFKVSGHLERDKLEKIAENISKK